MIRPFFIALQFLTRVPTPPLNAITEKEVSSSQYFYVLVGLIIGVLLYFSSNLLTLASTNLEAALILSLWVLITGALHIDGLADCADAWVGGYGDKEKTLSIMKDPQSGPIAITLIVCILLIKFTAIEALITNNTLYALIAAPVIARGLLPMLFHTTTYVRSNGLGSPLTTHKSKTFLTFSLLVMVGITTAYAGLDSYIIIIASLCTFLAIRHVSMKRINGITGDVAGALVELTEVTVLVTILCL